MSLTTSDLMGLDRGEDLLDEVMRDKTDRARLAAFIRSNYPLDQEDGHGRNALSWAAAEGFAPEIELMMQRDIRLDKPDEQGKTPLILAAEGGHFDAVKLFVTARVPVDAQDKEGFTAAERSLSKGFNDVTAYLIGSGAKPPAVDISTELAQPASVFSRPLRMQKKPSGV